MLEGGRSVVEAQAACKDRRAGQFCRLCGAWLGALGLEPDYRQFIEHMVEVFELVRDVLADDGTLWLNIGDSYANDGKWGGSTGGKHVNGLHGQSAGLGRGKRYTGLKPKDLCMIPARLAIALQDAGWWVRSDIIWNKPNQMPESITDRPTKSHEYIFLLSKSERYYYDQAAIRERASDGTHDARGRSDAHKWADGGPYEHGQTIAKSFEHMRKVKPVARWDTEPGPHTAIAHAKPNGRRRRKLVADNSGIKNNRSFDAAMAVMPDSRNKRSVWTVATEAFSEAHFATFPRKLIEPCILAGAPPGGIVLDPFMGSGTTAQVAEHLGRQWVGCELQRDYLPMQAQRLAQRALTF
jgi:site-specific DNA-methyltransferase (cytosine-N4-specific)